MSDRRVEGGRWLKKQRESRGMSAADLATAIGATRQSISAYENGRSGVGDEMAAKIARALGLGETATRRALGLYVAGDAVDDRSLLDVAGVIRSDPRLIPEARKHLLNQYQLLVRLSDASPSSPDAVEAERARQHAEVQAKGEAMLDEIARRRDASDRTRRGPRRPK